MDKHVYHVSSSAGFYYYYLVSSIVPKVSGEHLLG